MADVIVAQFAGAVGAVDDRVQAIVWCECRCLWIVPGIGIEVQTNDEVGLELLVDDRGSMTNLRRAKKKQFAAKLHTRRALRIVAAQIGFWRIANTFHCKVPASCGAQCFRPLGSRRTR